MSDNHTPSPRFIVIKGEKGGMGKSNIGSLLSLLNNDERDRLNPDAPKHQK